MPTRLSSFTKSIDAELHNLLFGKAPYRPQQISACLAAAGLLRGRAASSFVTAALDLCRELYLAGRSPEAVPVARTCVELANRRGEMALRIRAHTALGNLLGDCGDLISAAQQHRESLALAESGDDKRNIAIAYSNLGVMYNYASDYRASIGYHQRAIDVLPKSMDGELFYRACLNIADNCIILNRMQQGLKAIQHCTAIEATATIPPHSLVLMRRNHIRLLIQAGRLDDVPTVLSELKELVEDHHTMRGELALCLSRGVFAVARSRTDLGRTLLAQALEMAEAAAYGRGDTLIALEQAEKAAGNRRAAANWLAQIVALASNESLKKERLCVELANAGAQSSHDLALSERDWKMLSLLHLPAKMIAEQVHIKEDTVRKYLAEIYRTIGAGNKTDAAIWYQKQLMAKNRPAAIHFSHPGFTTFVLQQGLRAALGWFHAVLQPHDCELLLQLEHRANMPTALAVAPIEDMRWHMAGFFHHQRNQNNDAAVSSATWLYCAILRRLQLQTEGDAAYPAADFPQM